MPASSRRWCRSRRVRGVKSRTHFAVLLYGRLGSFYLFYFGALGALVPFWGPYLSSQGLAAGAIGGLMAILAGTKIVAPLLWGLLVDRWGRRMPLVRLATWLAALTFGAIYWANDLWSLAAVTLVFSFFWNAALPPIEAVTFNHLGRQAHRYAHIRVWGSVGFILTVIMLGAAVNALGPDIVPTVVLALLVGLGVSAGMIPEAAPLPGPASAGQSPLRLTTLLKPAEIRGFLLACLLMQLSHGAYYGFYSLYLAAAGYSETVIGALWAFGVAVEVVVFARMDRLLARFGARRVLLASLACATLRWILIGGGVDWPVVQVLAQTLHGATFGAFHAAGIYLTHHYFPGPAQGRGQALYNALGFGAGGALGSLLAGWLWTQVGGNVTFLCAALPALLGWWLVQRHVDPRQRY